MSNVYFVISHPIQYYSPLFSEFAKEAKISFDVLYFSDMSTRGYRDREFGVDVKWDIPLLSGYNYSFLKNYAPKWIQERGFFGFVNLGVVTRIKNSPKDAVFIVHGWAYFSSLLTVFIAKVFGRRVFLRAETPQNQEFAKGVVKDLLKRIFFKLLLFPCVDRFLYIGSQNFKFYIALGVSEKRLIFSPYAVDNRRFDEVYQAILNDKHSYVRRHLGISQDATVLLFSGKFVSKKRPMDLLRAFERVQKKFKVFLVMMGDGDLRGAMEKFIRDESLGGSVFLTGFVNQSQVQYYYAASDMYVMCSGLGETWGLSVNEAMNFRLPLVVSDLTGCSADLVKHGENGFIFETKNVADLATTIEKMIQMPRAELSQMGRRSFEIIQEYSYRNIIDNLKNSLR